MLTAKYRLLFCSCGVRNKLVVWIACCLTCTILNNVVFTVIVESETDWSSSGYDCLVSDRNYSIFLLCSSFDSEHSISIAVAEVCTVFSNSIIISLVMRQK